MYGRFKDKVVWIVGADLPVGQALTKAFAAEGAQLILSGVETAPEGIEAKCFAESPVNDEIARATIKDCTQLDNVVIVQPDSPNMTIEECPVEFWDEELYKGLGAAWCAVRAAMRIIGPQRKGSICAVTTIHDEKPTGCKFMHSVCAGGINMLMREAAQDCGRLGGNIRANVVEMGPLEGDEERMAAGVTKTYYTLNTRVPRGRPGTPEDACGPVLFLCSDDAGYINGSTLRVDGGFIGYYGDGDSEARWKYGYT